MMDNGLAAGCAGETEAVLCLAVSHSHTAMCSAAELMIGGVDQQQKKCLQLQKWVGCISFRRKHILGVRILYC